MAQIAVKLQPLRTPNFVIADIPPRPREEGFKEAPKYHLAELDANTLSELCDEFRAEVFRKAGKSDPNRHD